MPTRRSRRDSFDHLTPSGEHLLRRSSRCSRGRSCPRSRWPASGSFSRRSGPPRRAAGSGSRPREQPCRRRGMVGQRDHLVEDREPADLEATPPQSLLPDVSPASRPRRLLVAGMSLVLLAGCTQLPTPTPAQQPVPAPAVAARTIAPSATATAAPTPTATPRATASPGLASLPRPSMSPTTQVTTSMRVPYTPAIACA